MRMLRLQILRADPAVSATKPSLQRGTQRSTHDEDSKDKAAIVTGAASGIGKDIALRLRARRRQRSRSPTSTMTRPTPTAGRDPHAGGGQAIGIAMDVTSEDGVNAGVAATVAAFGGVDILVSNAGIQIVHPLEEFTLRRMEEDARDPPRRRVPHDPRLPAAHVQVGTRRQRHLHGLRAFEGSLAAQGAVRRPPSTASSGSPRSSPRKARKHGVRANVICPGFVRTPLVDKQIPEQAKTLGISEDEVIKKVMLKDTVDGEFTTVRGRRRKRALFFAAFPTNALTGQSLVVSHGWFMQ